MAAGWLRPSSVCLSITATATATATDKRWPAPRERPRPPLSGAALPLTLKTGCSSTWPGVMITCVVHISVSPRFLSLVHPGSCCMKSTRIQVANSCLPASFAANWRTERPTYFQKFRILMSCSNANKERGPDACNVHRHGDHNRLTCLCWAGTAGYQ